jgi:phenylacetate-coenzyme A ligase PaaK-like adenylate-forming protein
MTAVAVTVDPLSPQRLQAHALELLERDTWSRERLLEHRRDRLRALIRHATTSSPYYREALGGDAEHAELEDLPTLSKSTLMEEFDRVVTDPRLQLAQTERFLGEADSGALHLGEYRVFSTSGTTGIPGLFVYSRAEFAHWLAVMLRSMVRLGLRPGTRLVGVGAPSALHISQQSIAALQAAGRSDAPRLSVLTPLEETVAALNEDQPEMLGGYASVMGLLAEEQLSGRLAISPRVVLTTSEVLTEDVRARIEAAWTTPVQGYFSTEVLVIASDSLDHVGMHVCEDVILEVVDENDRPVAPGTLGSKVLLTNLVNYAQPLIRYELSDAVELAAGPDPSGRPFDRIARVDGRSDDVLRLPAKGGGVVAVHPYRLRAPFTRLLDVLQYQIVQRANGLVVRVVPRAGSEHGLEQRVREAMCAALAEAGAASWVRVELVDAIERETGHAAKVKLVVSEVEPAA